MPPKKDRGPTKAAFFKEITDESGLTKAQVALVMQALSTRIAANLAKSPHEITIPGLMKITRKYKKARPARPGRNPFTGEEMMFKAKPATNVVKVRPLKGLKDMV